MRSVAIIIFTLTISIFLLGCIGGRNIDLDIPLPTTPNPFEHPRLGWMLNKTYYIYETQGIDAAKATTVNAKVTGEKSAIELQALKGAHTPVDFEATLAGHPDKIGVDMVRQILQENGVWNNGMPKQGNLARAREISYTPELMKQRALKNLENINIQLLTMDKTSPVFTQLQEKKNQLEQLYKLQDEINKPTWGKGKDGKDTWLWWTKSGKPVLEREGQVPSEVQKEVMKPDKGVTWGPEKTRPDGSKYQEGSNGQVRETFKPHAPDKTVEVAEKQAKTEEIKSIREVWKVNVKQVEDQIELAESPEDEDMWRKRLGALEAEMKFEVKKVLRGDKPETVGKKKSGKGIAPSSPASTGKGKLYQNYLQ